MFEGIAIIISSFISVVGMVAIQFFNYRQRKVDLQDRLTFEAFQKRFAVYEDVIRTLSSMITNEELPPDISAKDVNAKINDYANTVGTLNARLSMFGSPGSIKILGLFRHQIFDVLDTDIDADSVIYAPHISAVLYNLIKNVLSEFTESARIEASVNIVDEFIKKNVHKATPTL
jgi:hypothetical protein